MHGSSHVMVTVLLPCCWKQKAVMVRSSSHGYDDVGFCFRGQRGSLVQEPSSTQIANGLLPHVLPGGVKKCKPRDRYGASAGSDEDSTPGLQALYFWRTRGRQTTRALEITDWPKEYER